MTKICGCRSPRSNGFGFSDIFFVLWYTSNNTFMYANYTDVTSSYKKTIYNEVQARKLYFELLDNGWNRMSLKDIKETFNMISSECRYHNIHMSRWLARATFVICTSLVAFRLVNNVNRFVSMCRGQHPRNRYMG